MIDTHTHLNFKDFAEDYAEVWQRAQTAGVSAALVVGSQLETSRRAVEIANELDGLYTAVGLHPIHAGDEDFDIENYRELVSNAKRDPSIRPTDSLRMTQDAPTKRDPLAEFTLSEANVLRMTKGAPERGRVVAIGEIGLDYFHHSQAEFGALQEKILRQFLALANELNLPCILHCRGAKNNPQAAYDELSKILDDFPETRGVLHCFTADWATAEKYLARGFYLGFTGVVTFAPEVAVVAAQVPLDRLLVETDCPYLAPAPKRGERCEPADVLLTAEYIARAKNISLAELETATDKNARKLFGF